MCARTALLDPGRQTVRPCPARLDAEIVLMGDPDRLQVEGETCHRRKTKACGFTFGQLGNQARVKTHGIVRGFGLCRAIGRIVAIADRLQQPCDRRTRRSRGLDYPVVDGDQRARPLAKKTAALDADQLDPLAPILMPRFEPQVGTTHHPAPCLGCCTPAL